MTYVVAEPEMMASVAMDLERIGSTISAANAAAAGRISGLAAAAGDEVSAAIANVLAAHGQEYQAVATHVAAFHSEFHQALAAAGRAYAQAETAGVAALQGALVAPAQGASAAPAAAMIPPFMANEVSLFLGGTGDPIPSQNYVERANALYVRSTETLQRLFTPEELYPATGVRSLTLNRSVNEGIAILDNTLYEKINDAGQSVTVFGYSQSSVIASLEMRNLAAGASAFGATPPDPSQLNFVLTGNVMNPNGGMLARFPDLSIPSLGLTFYGGTPSDTPYETAIYTLEYDGFADFPRYPLNFISTLNAVMGIGTVHPTYMGLTQAQVDSAIQLPTSPGYSGNTTYYMIETENLPLLAPLRAIPVIGSPLANLFQPSLEVIVNLGYGDPEFGYSTSPADVTTPFGLFPDVSPLRVLDALNAGAQEGIHDFTADMHALQAQPPAPLSLTLPQPVDFVSALNAIQAQPPAPLSLALPQPVDFVNAVTAAPTPIEIVNGLTTIASDDYALLLPTADIGVALLVTLPMYNAGLFVSELAQGDLIDAIGLPIAATVGLTTIAGAVELATIGLALYGNVQTLQGLAA
ncbi:PE family protein [Mycobacterium spongiae]|uniref:PE-PPE domain-containing protein n=1 Tax=Mycobacterium spongiae TaxID=886343 RepID=A0A975JXZ9_9MYCO|nr:PE-PPE domain-containing protein [Mycobacterium spongiae]QUR67764.1 PE-PPE domain-containing protein [Mycobacterium spongiae]